jgi:CBS domain-containing protein
LRPLWAGAGPLFPLETAAPTTIAMLSCGAAGLASGAVSALMTVALYRVEDLFGRLPVHWMWWPALGGLAVGAGGALEPRALGVGYDVIGDLLANHMIVSAALGLLVVKFAIWVVALGSGTSGGVLAPLLMIGAGLGVVLSPWLAGGSPQLWALVCMAAILGGMMRAPLTAVVFAFGLTHDVNAFLPTILSCAVAYGFTVVVMPRSILTEKIARRGRHVFREYGVDPLERHFVDEVMTSRVVTVPAAQTVAAVREAFFGVAQSHRAYPAVDGEQVVGMIDRSTLTDATDEDASAPVRVLLAHRGDAAFALPSETCRAVAQRLAASGLERLPVVDEPHLRRLVGIVSRSDLLKPLRAQHEEEAHRERPFRVLGRLWSRD